MNSNVIDLSQVSERTEMASVAEVPHENLPAVVAANPLDLASRAGESSHHVNFSTAEGA